MLNLEDLLSNPAILQQIGAATGLANDQAQVGLEALLPAVTRGIGRNGQTGVAVDALAKALGSGRHERYVDQPETLKDATTRDDGNAILGHIFGSKEVSRNVAGYAAQTSGLDSTVLKKMLPIVASLAMAALSKGSERGAALEPARGNGADFLGSLLGGLTRSVQTGSSSDDGPLDDILDLAKQFF